MTYDKFIKSSLNHVYTTITADGLHTLDKHIVSVDEIKQYSCDNIPTYLSSLYMIHYQINNYNWWEFSHKSDKTINPYNIYCLSIHENDKYLMIMLQELGLPIIFYGNDNIAYKYANNISKYDLHHISNGYIFKSEDNLVSYANIIYNFLKVK